MQIGSNVPKLVLAGAIAVIVAVVAWLIFSPSADGPSAAPKTAARPAGVRPVYVAPAKREIFGDRLEAIGTLSANESITVTAKAQGIVRSLNFDDGQIVQKGQEIVSIAAAEQDARVDVEVANLEEQRKELERAVDLTNSNTVSRARLDERRSAVKRAEANLAAARARANDFRVWAPFGGILGTRKVSPGALVSPGTVITTLDDITVVKLDFSIPENFLAALKPGLLIEATSSAYPGETFKGEVVTVDSRVDPVTRSLAVRAEVPNTELRLRPGMLMIVALIKDQRESIMIPEHALMPDGAAQFVYVVGADNVATRVQVNIGRRRPGFVEVVNGLNEGDLVVTEGTMDLRPGGKVEILKRPGADKSHELTPSAPSPG